MDSDGIQNDWKTKACSSNADHHPAHEQEERLAQAALAGLLVLLAASAGSRFLLGLGLNGHGYGYRLEPSDDASSTSGTAPAKPASERSGAPPRRRWP